MIEEGQQTVEGLLCDGVGERDRAIVCVSHRILVIREGGAQELRVLLKQVPVHPIQRTLHLKHEWAD